MQEEVSKKTINLALTTTKGSGKGTGTLYEAS